MPSLFRRLIARPPQGVQRDTLELELDEWYVHRRTGVKYVPVGLDAAVSSWHDFRFTNSLSFPITLTILPQCGALTVLMKRGPGALPLDPA